MLMINPQIHSHFNLDVPLRTLQERRTLTHQVQLT